MWLLIQRASEDHDSAHPLDKNSDLGSCGIRDLAEGPSKFGDSGGRVDRVVARKDAAPPSEATRSTLSCLTVAKYPPIYLSR